MVANHCAHVGYVARFSSKNRFQPWKTCWQWHVEPNNAGAMTSQWQKIADGKATMARNKIRDQARRQRAERRDQRRMEARGAEMLSAVADAADSPSQIVAGHELLKALHDRTRGSATIRVDQHRCAAQPQLPQLPQHQAWAAVRRG
jgi:hypothetical protein